MNTIDTLAQVFVQKLEAGVVPWYKPWATFGVPGRLR